MEDRIDKAALAQIEKKISTEKAAIEAVMFLVYDIRVSKMSAFDAKKSSKSDDKMTNDPREII